MPKRTGKGKWFCYGSDYVDNHIFNIFPCQVLVSDRKLRLQGRPPLLADPTLVWGVGVMVPINAVRIPPGFRTILLGNRLALHTVCAENTG